MTQQNERGTEPDIESIARRAIGLARYTQRAQMEMAAAQAGNPGIQARVQDLATPGDLILRGTLRPAAEIEAARRVAELWHWRATVAGAGPNAADLPLGLTYKDMATFNASAAYERGEIPAPIDGDFPITGKAYADLSPEDLTYAGGIARQRHFALNWLCGYGKTWDETSTET